MLIPPRRWRESSGCCAEQLSSCGLLSTPGVLGRLDSCRVGGVITPAINWRPRFQTLIIIMIVFLSPTITDPFLTDPNRSFDTLGAIHSAVGLVLVVMGILAADNNGPQDPPQRHLNVG